MLSFYINYKICKYDHSNSRDILEHSEKISVLESSMKKFEKEMEKKVESFENKYNTFIKVIAEKDIFISTLEEKLENMDTKFAAMIKKQDNTIEKLNDKISNFENPTAKIEEQKLKCEKCEFTTLSKQSMKTHLKRKHTASDTEKYPRTCDMCEEKLDNFKDMMMHMKTHSYKKTKYRCENCEFWGSNEMTMEVHFGRNHSENVECGLCEFKAKVVKI